MALTPVTTKTFAAQKTGMAEDKIRSVKFELDYLRMNGLLIDINVTGVGMFTRSAQLAEFGIRAEDDKAKRYTPGSKFLIPKQVVDQLRSIEARMRQLHTKYAIDVTGFKPYRWLPYTSYPVFKSKWLSLQAEFQTIKNLILASLDNYQDLLTAEFAAGAQNTWNAIEAQGYGAIIYNGRGYWERREFVDAVVEAAQAQFPSYAKVEAELQADYSVGVIYTDYDESQQREVAQQAVAQARAEKQAAYLQESLLQEEYNHQSKMHELEEQEKALKVEAMLAAELEHAKTQLETMRHPFEEVFISLRLEMAAACDEIKASIEKNGFVRGKIAQRAAGLIEFYDLMAAHNDKELRAKLVELRSKIGEIGEERAKETPKRNVEAIADTLKDIIQMANLEAAELADLSRAAFLEV